MQVLFIQGAGATTHAEWDRKLVASLERELPTVRVRYPLMPTPDDPQYAAWSEMIHAELAKLDEGDVLVGHSIGGTMLIHALAEQAPAFQPGGLFLIAAPFIGEQGWPSDQITTRTDFGERLAMPVFLYHGSDDETVPTAHARFYADTMPEATVRILDGRDHQLNNDLVEVARDIRALPR